jgi:hypothetical protein
VRQEALEERFQETLARLDFGDKVLGWVTKALRDSHVDEKKEHDAAIARLQTEYDRLQRAIIRDLTEVESYPKIRQMKANLTFRQKLRKGDLRLKIELDLWRVLVAAWLLLGLLG